MKYRIAAALLLFVGSTVLVAAGAGFACYAIYAALVPQVGSAAAAAIAAAVLLFVPLAGLAILVIRARSRRPRLDASQIRPHDPDDVTLVYLAGLARDKPLVAITLAGLFGAASVLLRTRK